MWRIANGMRQGKSPLAIIRIRVKAPTALTLMSSATFLVATAKASASPASFSELKFDNTRAISGIFSSRKALTRKGEETLLFPLEKVPLHHGKRGFNDSTEGLIAMWRITNGM